MNDNIKRSNVLFKTLKSTKEGGVHQSGSIPAPGSVEIDHLIGTGVPMPLSFDTNDGIVTLSPSPISEATNASYKNRVFWAATYSDGNILTEYDDGESISSEMIDHKRLREFSLIDHKNRVVVSQEIIPGQCFFYRRRTALQTGKDVVDVLHMFGWRYPIGTNVLEDGTVEKEYMDNLVVLFESDMHVEVGCFDSAPVDPSANLSGRKSWKYPINWRDIDEVAAE